MSKKSIGKNYLYNVSYQILLIIIPLITTPYISRVLGANGIGKYSFAESIVTYFVLAATMGVTYYGQREIAFLQDDRKRRTQLFWETKCFTIIVSGISLLVYFLFAIHQENSILYLILAINIINVAFDVTWLFQGMEEFAIITSRNAVCKVMNVIFIFLFVKGKNDVWLYALGMVIFTLAANISMWPKIKTYVDLPEIKSLKPFRNFKVIFSLFVPTIAIQVYTVLDKTMIGVITGDDAQNGYYDQAIRISKIILTLVTALGTVMVPRIGYHFKKKDYEQVEKYMYRGYNFVWFLGTPLCFGLIGVAENTVPWFYGTGYDAVVPLLKILALLILAIGINNVTGIQYLIPTERQNTFTFTVVIGAIINFALNGLLIPHWQAVGAAVSSVIAETSIALVQIYIVRKEIRPLQIFSLSWKYFLAGGVMLLGLQLANQHLSPSFIHSLIMMISGAVVYFVMLLLLRDQFLMQLLHTVKERREHS